MIQLTKFMEENNLPLIDLTIEPNIWHKLEDANFKGAFIFKQIKLGSKELTVLTVYNYRSGESLTEKFGEGEFSKAEQTKIKKILDEQEAEAKKERERKHEQCRKYAEEQFQSLTMEDISTNPYTRRKLLGNNLSAEPIKWDIHNHTSILGEVRLVAPIVDDAGTLWNYQTITGQGEKQLLMGGKMQGLFIPIMPIGQSVVDLRKHNRVYIVEGYSTGLSVALALKSKYPVLCAISSTNIMAVCEKIRGSNGKISIIICADNDSWKPDQGNTGEKAAIDVVSRVDGCAYVIPDFSGCDDAGRAQKPTDYNDLHNLQGLAEVERQIGSVVLNRPRIIYPLGYNQKTYYFTTSKVPQIQGISEFSETDLYKLAPRNYWLARFSTERGQIDIQSAKSYLIEKCQDKGLFESNRLRGRGLYKDEGRYIHNLGDKVQFLDTGEEKDLADMQSAFYYDPRPAWHYEGQQPDINLIKDLYTCLQKFAWSHPLEAQLCLGWLLTTPLAGCLAWRSHLAVTSEAGTGKTTLLQALSGLLAGFLPMKSEGLTEAGLRQALGSDAVPVILDEQDTNSLDSKSFDKIMSLFRMASSEGEVRKGTPSGKAMRFNACFSGLIAGINLPKMKHADLTRFCIIELNPNNKVQSWADMSKDIKMLFKPESAKQLHSWILANIEPMQKAINEIAPMIELQSDARTAQQYANLIGASAYALGIPIQEAADALYCYWKREDGDDITNMEKDSVTCMDHLLDFIVIKDEDQRQVSLGQALQIMNEPGAVLAQFNMQLQGNKLFIPNANPLLSKHFDRTPWPNWNKALKRVKGTEQKQMWVGGRSIRGLLVPVTIKKANF